MYEGSKTVARCAVATTESAVGTTESITEGWTAPGISVMSVPVCNDMNRLTDEVRREPPWTMLFADDIVICKETREEVDRRLKCWRYALERREMKVSRSKTEYSVRKWRK